MYTKKIILSILPILLGTFLFTIYINANVKNNNLIKNYVKKAINNKCNFKVIDTKQNGSQFMYKLKDKDNNNFWIFYSDVTNKYLNNKKFKVLSNKENDFSYPGSKVTYNQLKTLVNRFKGKDKKVTQTSLKETLKYKKSHEEIYDTPFYLN